MKRSKAVDELVEILADAKYGRSDVELDVERLADNILIKLEEFGMLPPRTMLYPLKLEDNAWEQE